MCVIAFAAAMARAAGTKVKPQAVQQRARACGRGRTRGSREEVSEPGEPGGKGRVSEGKAECLMWAERTGGTRREKQSV